MDNCIFCKIARKEIPASIIYEDEKTMAFKDINPVAPVHVLIIPKKHIASVNDLDRDNAEVLIDIHLAASKIAKEFGISDNGYRLINNCGADAGQTVLHIHYHLLGGKDLGPIT